MSPSRSWLKVEQKRLRRLSESNLEPTPLPTGWIQQAGAAQAYMAAVARTRRRVRWTLIGIGVLVAIVCVVVAVLGDVGR